VTEDGGERRALRFRAAGWVGAWVIRVLMAIVRVRVEGDGPLQAMRASGRPFLFVCWHGHLLPLVHLHRGHDIVVLASEHRDGEYITQVLAHLGFAAARGSSTRGGERGLRDLIRAARDGRTLAITPDGPRGPREAFKEGAIVAARMTGLPIIPIVAACSNAWRLGSWDRFLIPRPFSRVEVVTGDPIPVPRALDAAGSEALRLRIEEIMRELSARAEARVEGR